MGTHDHEMGVRAPDVLAPGAEEGGGETRTLVSTGLLTAEAFRLGLTPVYVNGLGAQAKRVAGKLSVGGLVLIYSKAFPKYAPGKALQAAPS